ncbi:MAG: hyaluronate lyase, partial [Ornithinimicrobium sp.]
ALGRAGSFAGRSAFALRGYAPTPTSRRGTQVIRFGVERQPSYAWSFDRGDGWANVGYGEVVRERPDQPPLSRALMLHGLQALLPGAAEGAGQWLGHHLPLSKARFAHPGGPVLFVGDAAGLVNPLTGEGIYYAVATGALAGRCAVEMPSSPAARYARAVRRLLGWHLRTTTAASALAVHPRLLELGLEAARADQQTFDDIVEIGLGRGVPTTRVLSEVMRRATG